MGTEENNLNEETLKSIQNLCFYRKILKIIYQLSSKSHHILPALSGYMITCLITVNQLFSYLIEPRCEKTNVLVSDQVPHKPGCTATEDG